MKKQSSTLRQPTRILLIDDHPLVREGLTEVLTRQPDLVICGEAEDRQQALKMIPQVKPDLAIIDLALKNSNGIELIKDIGAQFPNVRMLVVSMQDELTHAERVLRAGASGYITKDEAAVRVVEAVREVLRGGSYVSARVASRMATKLSGRSASRTEQTGNIGQLTDRELEILELIGDGLSRQQIAAQLGLDVNTVETYRGRLRLKLEIKDAQELLQYAIRYNRNKT